MATVILNGKKVETTAKEAMVAVKGTELKLTLVYVNADNDKAIKFSWKATETVQVNCTKVENKVSCEIKDGNKVLFSNLTAQGVFTVLETALGISWNISNRNYVRANTTRKESKRGGSAAAVKVTEGTW